MNDDFGVTLGPEAMAFGQEPIAQFDKVVDLAIEYYPERVVLVAQRLVAPGEVYYGEAPKAQSRVLVDVGPIVVGSAMRDDVGHTSQEWTGVSPEGLIPAYESGESTHGNIDCEGYATTTLR
jgi:hypothetical protein